MAVEAILYIQGMRSQVVRKPPVGLRLDEILKERKGQLRA